jgi:hypothetical protein
MAQVGLIKMALNGIIKKNLRKLLTHSRLILSNIVLKLFVHII